jgi:hypothetical protein
MTCKHCDDWGYIDYGYCDQSDFDSTCICDCAAGQWACKNGLSGIKTPQAIAEIAELRRAHACATCGGHGWLGDWDETCPDYTGAGSLAA